MSKIQVTPPIKKEDIKLSKPDTVAAGIPAVTSSLKHIAKEMNFFAKHSVAELSTWSDYQIGKSGRITEPMILREGDTHYSAISWEEAFSTIAKELNGLDSPDEAIFYTSGRTSNEAAFLYQLFVRQYGTNNLPDCSNMCHESSGKALGHTLGIGKGSVKLEDFYVTDLVIVVGQNPGTNHPRMLSALEKSKKAGAKIITVNPLPEAGLIKFKHPQQVGAMLFGGTKLTDLFLQIKINEDVALFKAMLKMLLAKEEANPGTILDQAFINDRTSGYDEMVADLSQYDLDELMARTGIPTKQIKEAVDLIVKSKKIIICWAMGLTQHKNGVDNIQEVVNLLLMKGSIGKPGAGTCPVRGHSNVQGDRTMGIWEVLTPQFSDKLEQNFTIKAMDEGKAKVFFAMGGNFLSATPDTELTAKALQKCSLTVQVSTKPNRSHLVHGKTAIILPCLGRSEKDEQASGQQFVTVENSMGIVHSSEGHRTPPSDHLLSEPMIVAQLATATLKNTKTDWLDLVSDYDKIRNAIEQTIPGFDNYNKRVRHPAGFYLPNGARDGNFKTATGKANFTINQLADQTLKAGEYMMMTIRSHDQYNTTIYGNDDRYRGIKNARRVILMNKQDMKAAGLKAKQKVDLYSHYDGDERCTPEFIVVPYDIPRGDVATYFPEANPLIPISQVARKSNTPASKSIIITMKPSKA